MSWTNANGVKTYSSRSQSFNQDILILTSSRWHFICSWMCAISDATHFVICSVRHGVWLLFVFILDIWRRGTFVRIWLLHYTCYFHKILYMHPSSTSGTYEHTTNIQMVRAWCKVHGRAHNQFITNFAVSQAGHGTQVLATWPGTHRCLDFNLNLYAWSIRVECVGWPRVCVCV